jgi:hypothetical protein
MTPGRLRGKVSARTKEEAMNGFLGTFLAFAFVVGTLLVVGLALFELSPFARHHDTYRDPRTGKSRGSSPRLD